jgi:hypothetical protein
MLWRFSANDSHLYPGALLRDLDASREVPLSSGDELLVEFSDGVIARGRLLEVGTDAVVLQMPLYRTARETDVQARTWRVVPGDDPGLMKVNKRLPAE